MRRRREIKREREGGRGGSVLSICILRRDGRWGSYNVAGATLVGECGRYFQHCPCLCDR